MMTTTNISFMFSCLPSKTLNKRTILQLFIVTNTYIFRQYIRTYEYKYKDKMHSHKQKNTNKSMPYTYTLSGR